MKYTLLIIYILINLNSYCQENKEIVTFNTNEKLIKKVVISEKIFNTENLYVISAQNQTTREYAGCKWKSSLSNSEMKTFIKDLRVLRNSSDKEIVRRKRILKKIKNDRVKVKFDKVKCDSEHKTHYFQKSCNRNLTFIVDAKQEEKIISIMEDNFLQKEPRVSNK